MPNAITEEYFRDLTIKYLVPMFGGAKLVINKQESTPNQSKAALTSPCTIDFKPAIDWGYRLRIQRSQPFRHHEMIVVDHFMATLGKYLSASRQDYFPLLVESIPEIVVAKSCTIGTAQEQVATSIIRQLDSWSSQTYEGGRIACAIGVDFNLPAAAGVNLEKIKDQDFAKVLTNGFDTMLCLDSSASVSGLISLAGHLADRRAPNRLSAISAWCDNHNKTAFILNQKGEILILRHDGIEFARRHGIWHRFEHSSCVTRIGRFNTDGLKEAVYRTCLDVSFARTGGCICLVKSTKMREVNGLIAAKDRFSVTTNVKSQVLSKCFDTSFHTIDRRLRQELAAIDGATVIDYQGNILAAGAIVRVPGGSVGGGRRAAAVALSRLGAAIKISEDGGICCFLDSGPNGNPNIGFELCI